MLIQLAVCFEGGLASAVPGEIAGYWKAHQIAGKLPWKRLFEPAISYCRNGFKISPTLANALGQSETAIRRNPSLKRLFVDPVTDKLYRSDDVLRLPALARTLEIISENGSKAFYDGQLSNMIVEENNFNGRLSLRIQESK
jgi:gamma-glutamyltranspeptidase/glutathione hydrolase/leukotriene-C4 hydrolase